MRRLKLALIMMVIVTMTVFAFSSSQKANYDVIENEYLYKVDDIDQAKALAAEYDLELLDLSNYGIATYLASVTQDPTELIRAGFVYNGKSQTAAPPWQSTEDPYLDNQYALELTDTIDAWTLEAGISEIVVAIIDSGVDATHSDLQGRVSALSYNVVTDIVGISAVADDTGHGTMVAGVIGAIRDNSIGIAGIVQNVQLLVIKANIANEGSFSDSSIIDGIYYAVDNGADIINLSLGGSYANPLTAEAVQYAQANNVLVVGAAGNDGVEEKVYPASFPEVISVSAVDKEGVLAEYSNYNSEIDIAAPGSEIVTTAVGGGYASVSGTSFAAPQISGILALLLSHDQGISVVEAKTRLYSTAIDKGVIGWDIRYGSGLVNAYQLLSQEFVKISFETFAGSELEPIWVEANQPFLIPEKPVYQDHLFLGWYTDVNLTIAWRDNFDVTAQDMTLYAKYTSAYHTVTFISEGTNSGSVIVEHGDYITLPDSELEGHVFNGWYVDTGYLTKYVVSPVNGDLTLYAKFDPIIYHTVSLQALGTEYANYEIEDGTVYSPDDLVLEGYTFSGWFIDQEYTQAYTSSQVFADLTLYAKLEQIYLSVTLIVPESAVETLSVAYGSIPELPVVTYLDQDFSGWFYDEAFTLPYLAETLTTDVTLYAKFVLESYKVTIFIPNEPSYDIYISEGESLTMDALEVEGYDFGGWYYDEDFTILFEPGVIEAETTLYALLERIYFTVSFYDWDLTLISTQTVEYGTGAIAPADPLREDTIAFSYAFTGWDEEYSEVYQNLEIHPLFERTFKASSVRLLPGIDTLYQGDDWIDGGLELDDEELTYRIVLPPDTETIGRYEVVYEILAGSEVVYEIKRIVNVVELMIDVKIDLKKGITTLPVGAVYEDPGATTNVGTIETSGNVDTFTPGVYEIVYTVRINGWTYSKSRFVHVLETDDYAPVELYWHKEDDEYAL